MSIWCRPLCYPQLARTDRASKRGGVCTIDAVLSLMRRVGSGAWRERLGRPANSDSLHCCCHELVATGGGRHCPMIAIEVAVSRPHLCAVVTRVSPAVLR